MAERTRDWRLYYDEAPRLEMLAERMVEGLADVPADAIVDVSYSTAYLAAGRGVGRLPNYSVMVIYRDQPH